MVRISSTRRSAQSSSASVGAPVFTGVHLAFQHPHCRLAGHLRPAVGSPNPRGRAQLRRLLRGLRPVPRPSADDGPAADQTGCLARRATGDGSHVHQMIDRQGRCPALAPAASPRLRRRPSSRPAATGSSRTPSRLASRIRTVQQYRHVPSLSGLLSTLPGVSRISLPPASTRLLRQPGGGVLPPPLDHPAPRGAPDRRRTAATARH